MRHLLLRSFKSSHRISFSLINKQYISNKHHDISRRIQFFLNIAEKSKLTNNVEVLRKRIQNQTKSMTSLEFNEILSNLRGMNDGDTLTKVISRDLAKHLHQYGLEISNPSDLGLSYQSLSTMTGNSIEMQELHYELRRLIPPSPKPSLFPISRSRSSLPFPLPIDVLLNIYSSLQNMSSQVDSYEFLLESLYPHLSVQSCNLTLTECSNLLFCFQSAVNYSETLSKTIKLIFHRLNVLHSRKVGSTGKSELSIHQISKCMYGLRNIPNHFHEIKSIFEILSDQLERNKSKPITIIDLHQMICCLHGPHMIIYKQELKTITLLLCELIEYNYIDLEEIFGKNNEFNQSSFSILTYGPYLTDIFTSFSNQSSDNHLTQNLLLSLNTILLKKDPSSKKPLPRYYLTPKQIGLCLLSMRNLSCEHNGVSEVMKSLSYYMVKSMNNPLNESEIYPVHSYLTGLVISNCLQGMGSMSDENAAVKQMLQAIYEKLRYFKDIQFTPTQLCQSLNGFRGMTAKYQKITQIVEILIEKIESSNIQHPTLGNHSAGPRFVAKDISLAISGIQRMVPSDSLPNLLKLVNLLLDHGQHLLPEMTLSSLQIILTSLTHMISRYLPLPVTFMELLLVHIEKSIQNPPSYSISSDHYEVNKIILFQSLHLLKAHLLKSNTSPPPSLLASVNHLITQFSPLIPYKETQNIENKYENKIFNRLQGLFHSYSNIEFIRHRIVDGFSTDILLKIHKFNSHVSYVSDTEDEDLSTESLTRIRPRLSNLNSFFLLQDKEFIYNIEIDGPSHDKAKKQFYYERRDGYFQDVLGIKVIRLPLKDCGFQSGAKLDQFLRKILLENIEYNLLSRK